jgi:SnoaL-like domain
MLAAPIRETSTGRRRPRHIRVGVACRGAHGGRDPRQDACCGRGVEQQSLDSYFGLFSADVVYHGGANIELNGVAALRERYSAALAWCPDLTITYDLLVVGFDGKTSASVQTETGTAVDGTAFGFRGVHSSRLNESGLICEVWEMAEAFASPTQP